MDRLIELLLNVAIDYKRAKSMENIDWESCHSKYQDILDNYKEMYPTAEDAKKLGKDFPHNKEGITKLIVTSKLSHHALVLPGLVQNLRSKYGLTR